MSEKTVFKKIIDREIPADIVYEDELVLAFRDINPQAPVHVLVIPRREVVSLDELTEADRELMGHLMLVAKNLAGELGLEGGYRTVINCGDEGGQEVPHLHVHLLGGRAMQWPPG
jgi:histidine triad (HIT) family protein